MSGRKLPRAARHIPPSTAANPYPGRNPHWIRGNATERIPVRHIVADTESRSSASAGVEVQTLRCWDAVRWRTDLKAGEQREEAAGEEARPFWEWVLEWCHSHGRTVLWFHHASVDLAWLDAFRQLPALGCELIWCNLDRDVSVVKWRTPGGTLQIADTYTWTKQPLEDLGRMTGIPKPRLPRHADDLRKWHVRCAADVAITERVVRELLAFIRDRHLGNWQPSGPGMGWSAWRHRFYTHKVLVHDDADALAAEREAMHAGRAEAWWHGFAQGGPFTEHDMRMSYTTIARDCLLPAKLWATDPAPSRKVHEWALEHFRVLAEVIVRTDVPCVPARVDGRVCWPVGEFATTLWDVELALLRENGGRYAVRRQWRYTRKPVLEQWAAWSIAECGLEPPAIGLVAKTWVKHQARATIGRMGLRTASWEPYADNWLPGYTGLSLLSEGLSEPRRMMHVGSQVWGETGRTETQNSVPQITSWIMAEARCRLWRAAIAAGLEHVLHVDTDSLIADRAGTAALELAIARGLPGAWRPKATWRRLEVVGPRHYFTPTTRQVPGVPKRAAPIGHGKYAGELWESLATSLTGGRGNEVRVTERVWQPARVDYRRPYAGEQDAPARPMRVGRSGGDNHVQHDSVDPERGDRSRSIGAARAARLPRRASTGQETASNRPGHQPVPRSDVLSVRRSKPRGQHARTRRPA